MKLLFLVSCLVTVHSRSGFGPTEQEWGYVTVRPGAHMFWWLHKTSANVQTYTEKPLVIWLQGGPGGSSTGLGNFGELGPLDPNLNPRNNSWIQYMNVLFVDNPVGTGFSYVETLDLLTTSNKEIADDFLVLLQGVFEALPELKKVPVYIFSESYGGKMTVEIAQAIKESALEANLVGIGLGDSWVSPIDSVMSWSSYLLNLGFVDRNQFEQIQESAEATKAALDNGNFSQATTLWSSTEVLIKILTPRIDFYNVLNTNLTNSNSKIRDLMNSEVKEALGLDHVWGFQSGFVFLALQEDFMKPVTDIVEVLLNTTNVKIAVYNGQLDLIVDTPGTIKWVDALNFKDSDLWKVAKRNVVSVNSIVEGYYKKASNLAMYWINRAGHMVPSDNPEAMLYILQDLTNNFSTNFTNT